MHVSAGEIRRQRPVPWGDLIKRLALAAFHRVRKLRKIRPHPRALSAVRPVPEVMAVDPLAGVTPEELLRVAASALNFAKDPIEQAIARKAAALGIPLCEVEDFRRLPCGGIHCWVGGVPTLLGSRGVMSSLGICVGNVECSPDSHNEIFVAQGSRLLGRLVIRIAL